MIFITILWKFKKDICSFNLGNYIYGFELAFLFGCAGCLQHFAVPVSSMSTHSLSRCPCHSVFNSLQSYQVRRLKNVITCFCFQESAHSVAFLKVFFIFFLPFLFHIDVSTPLQEVISFGFTHSCYISGPLWFKKFRISMSRSRKRIERRQDNSSRGYWKHWPQT